MTSADGAPDRPRVTIGMGVRDAERTLAQAIASIRMQSFQDWELLIVDDGSVDASVAIARAAARSDPRIVALGGRHRLGLAARLNELVRRARSPLFGRMDADDVAYPDRLARQVAFLREHPEVDLVGASALVFGAGGRAIGVRNAPADHAEICARPSSGFLVLHPTWLGRLDWFRRYPYAERATRGEEQDVMHRAYRNSVFANIPEPLLGYREERVRLGVSVLGRAHFAGRAGLRLWHERHRRAAVRMIAEQAARVGYDALVIWSGLDHRVLRHRTAPLSPTVRAAWEVVWSATLAGPPTAASDPPANVAGEPA
jgi:glycosyltransferase involved in cell wall biosynthesis